MSAPRGPVTAGVFEPDGNLIPESLVLDPLTWSVDCELGEQGCTGADIMADMVRDSEGWICPNCDNVSRASYDDMIADQWRWYRSQAM